MGLGIRTFEQHVTAGSDFDGTTPDGDIVRANNLESWPEDVKGGLFDFDPYDCDQPLWVRSVELKLGGQSAWTVHKKDADGCELLILCGSDDTDFITTLADSFIITAKQCLIVRTTGATGKLLCRIHLQSPV
jgi:hypothetical protein